MSKYVSGIKGNTFSVDKNGIVSTSTSQNTVNSIAGVYTGIDISGNAAIEINAPSEAAFSYLDFTRAGIDYGGRIIYNHTSNKIDFHTNSLAASLSISSAGNTTISSGNILYTTNIDSATGSTAIGYNITKQTNAISPLVIYNNSTDRTVLASFTSAGTVSGANIVSINVPLTIGGILTVNNTSITENSISTTVTAGSILNLLAPNTSMGADTQMRLGVSITNNNSAALWFRNSASGSISNSFNLGFVGTAAYYTLTAGGVHTFNSTVNLNSTVNIANGQTLNVGTSGSSSTLNIYGTTNASTINSTIRININSDTSVLELNSTNSTFSYVDFTRPGLDYAGRIIYVHSSNSLVFYTNANLSSCLTLDSTGNLFGFNLNGSNIIATGTVSSNYVLTNSLSTQRGTITCGNIDCYGINTNNTNITIRFLYCQEINCTNINASSKINMSTNDCGIELNSTNSSVSYVDFTRPGLDYAGRIIYFHSSNSLVFHTNANGSSCLTLDSTGNLFGFNLNGSNIIATETVSAKILTVTNSSNTESTISNTSSSSNIPLNLLSPNLAVNNSNRLRLGVATSNNNTAEISFTYLGSGFASNYLSFSFYGTTTQWYLLNASGIHVFTGTVNFNGPISCRSINTNNNEIDTGSATIRTNYLLTNSLSTQRGTITCGNIDCYGINTNNTNITIRFLYCQEINCTNINASSKINMNTNDCGIELNSTNSSFSYVDFTRPGLDYAGRIIYNHQFNSLIFHTNANVNSCLTLDANGNLFGLGLNGSNITATGTVSSNFVLTNSLSTQRGTITCGGIDCYGINTNNSNITIRYLYCQEIHASSVIYATGGGVYSAEFSNSILVQNAVITGSDYRIKEDIEPIFNEHEILSKVNPCTYKYIDKTKNINNKKRYGLIAQDVEEIFPDAVITQINAIPNIMKAAEKISNNSFKLDVTIDISKKLRLYTSNIDNTKKIIDCYIVSHIDNIYTIDNDEIGDYAFIYGEFVDDFKSVEYNAFIPLLLAGYQSQFNTLVAQELRIKQLEDKIELLMQQ